MQSPADLEIVDASGKVYASLLTSAQADAMMSVIMGGNPFLSVHSEPMEGTRPSIPQMPASVPAIVQSAAMSAALVEIEPGSERVLLRQAIENRLDAAARIESANEAVERARAFLAACAGEMEALQATHDREIQASGQSLAAILKAGGAMASVSNTVDRGALIDAEIRHTTARAALEQLIAEQKTATTMHVDAETAVRLAVMAVKRTDIAAIVGRLETIKAEYIELATAIDAARFSDVPISSRSEQAMRIEPPGPGQIDAAHKAWVRYSVALREDPDATWEASQ
jgi:hypothetical protein